MKQMMVVRRTTEVALLLGILAGCGVKATQALDAQATFELGPSGGAATSPDGRLKLDLPAGALAAPTTISVAVDRRATAYASPVYVFGPSGTTFARPVKVTVQMPEEAAGRYLLANVDGASPVPLASSTYDAAAHVVEATLEHFSAYAVISASA